MSRSDLAELGCAGTTLTRAVRDGRLSRLRSGFYATPNSGRRVVIQAAARACSDSVISHRSAGELRGLPLLGRRRRTPELTVAPGNGVNVDGAHIYRATLREDDVEEFDGDQITTAARTVVDLARHCSRRAAVAAADFALHEGLTTEADIEDVMLFCWNWPGMGLAGRSLSLVDARAESPLESISRLAFGDLQLPTPVPQRSIGDEHGRFVARVDFGWEWLGVVGEADGLKKYTDADVLPDEKERQERLEQLGLVVVRWGWKDVTRQPQRLRARVFDAFTRAEALKRSGLPPRWSVLPAQTLQMRGKRDRKGG